MQRPLSDAEVFLAPQEGQVIDVVFLAAAAIGAKG